MTHRYNYYVFCMLSSFIIGSCSCSKEPKSVSIKDVPTLAIAELAQLEDLKKHEYAVVKFYLPTCPACSMSTPACQELSKKYPRVAFLAANVEDSEVFATEFSIRSVPTFITFKKGIKVGRLDGFNKEKLEQLIAALEQVQPTTPAPHVIEVTSQEQFKKELAQHPKVIAKFYGNWCGFCQLIAPEFERISREYPDITFLSVEISNQKELGQQYAPDGVPTFVAFKNGTEVDHFSGAIKNELERMTKDLAGQSPAAPNLANEPEEQPTQLQNDTED